MKAHSKGLEGAQINEFFFPDLESRKTELEGEVFEMLFTLTDFLAFKEMMVAYKVMKQAGALDNILSVTTI